MATVLTTLPLSAAERSARLGARRHSLLLATALTPLALLIHGFHPFTEDGGIYLAGVERLLHPALFPHFTAFVLAPTAHSAFARVLAALARATHLTSSTQLVFLVLGLHIATLWSTLFAAAILASRCWTSVEARIGSTLLLTCWLGLPIAGTSLLFMDPYLTARSFSTPCLIAALIGALDITADPSQVGPGTCAHGVRILGASLATAALFHPLMAGYAFLASALLVSCRIPARAARCAALAGVSILSLVAAAAIHKLAPPDTPAYALVTLTRGYWFLSSWHWYELIGIIAPGAILAAYAFGNRHPQAAPPAHALATAAVFCAVLVTCISMLFAHRTGPNHLVAALQPMRGLQFVYFVMMLFLGASLGSRTLHSRLLVCLISIPLLGVPLYAASRAAAPHTRHIELPGAGTRNNWVRAFVWIRTHTPPNALFALPPNYIGYPGEDAQCFRALAERSALPDYSKDGGEAAVAPALTPLWQIGQAAQANLATDSDQRRRSSLKPLGVSWLVLPAPSATGFKCPYSNAAVKVCRLD